VTLGRACLFLALTLAVYGAAASLYGARAGRPEWVTSGRRAVYALAVVLTVAFADLELAFVRSDFSYALVASHSSTTTPPFYRATAMWSAQEGSLLLWVWLLSLWSSAALVAGRRRVSEIAPYAAAVLMGFAAFFTVLLLGFADPFRAARPAPADGLGLTPLLRYPSMMIHPPLLYSGYTLFAVPFAFAIGALVTRRLDATWLGFARRFVLTAWLCLGVGILLGARWSYSELGWGGYWAWDPVENASLMPWLTGTALMHSMMIQERRGMLKVWNVSLMLASGILAVLGTFLVRSGILNSIHAFGASTLGVPFLIFIGLLVAGSIGLVVARRRELRTEQHLDSLLSREAFFLLNNLVLIGLCFVIFWGTFFPLISEALTGTKASVGPPWFDRYTVPLALVLVMLSALGPVIPWRRSSPAGLRRALLFPVGAGLVALAALAAAPGFEFRPAAAAMFSLAAAVAAAVAQELWRAGRALSAISGRSPGAALVVQLRRNRRRYGGYGVHVGIAVLLAGVAASSTFQHARDVRLRPGRDARVGGYDMRYVRPTAALSSEKVTLGAVLEVSRHGRHVATLLPSRGYYPSPDETSFGRIGRFFEGEATSEVGLRSSLRRDLWVAMQPDLTTLAPAIATANRRFPKAGPQLEGVVVSALVGRYMARPPAVQFRIVVSPLVSWIWLGGVIAAAGALFAVWPAPAARPGRVRARARATARTAGALGRLVS
jgi:cytochrome c-type biogenesis protein CcmF